LGVQWASKFGYNTVAIGRGADKESLAVKLGARKYIDSSTQDVAAELNKEGGANVILATAPDGKAFGPLVDGLAANGRLMLVGASFEPSLIPTVPLLMGRRSIIGWPSGTARDSEDTLKFAADMGVRAMIETFPVERAEEGYQRMSSGKVRFRAVLMH
ncbi:MAG TPA: zinc-binding dehydrogenase, partial [Candidatus Binatus sp.]|nr:zinc-binding dehydrogenase [Candidatus Binatus sp.]